MSTNIGIYPASVFWSEIDGGFIATAPDLPGCSAFGATQQAAVSELQGAIEAWVSAAQKAGNPVPEPSWPDLRVAARGPQSAPHPQRARTPATRKTPPPGEVVSNLQMALGMQSFARPLDDGTYWAMLDAINAIATLNLRLEGADEAIDQALDDMGAEGHSICEASKARLRLALGDNADPKCPPAYTLEAALRTLIECDEAHGKPSRLRAVLAMRMDKRP